MKTKKERLSTIAYLVENHAIGKQGELLNLLNDRGFTLTQATLSRDINQLKLIKTPDHLGNYIYRLPEKYIYTNKKEKNNTSISGFISMEFSGTFAVIKTRPGYAMGIASDIDQTVSHVILGTIAGDDTILLIPREGVSRKTVTETIALLIPEVIKN
jgi:transcriptional regulator of arginine metabolism